MREILFRGKTINSGEWVYGNLIQERYIVGDIEDWEEDYFNTEWWAVVDPKTVGQYTGIEDANGKKIFEGDILKDRESMVIVRFVDGEFSVDYKTLGGKWRHYENLFNYLEDYEGEAVGNIHDNPELLEEERK